MLFRIKYTKSYSIKKQLLLLLLIIKKGFGNTPSYIKE